MTVALDIAKRALAGIPGWSGATLTPLKGGLTNHTWLVTCDQQRAVLKADATKRSVPFAGRNAEANVQRIAAENRLAGKVLFSSPTVLLSEYIDGEVWTAASFSIDDNLVELAKTLRRVHALPLTGRRFDAPAAAQYYAANVGDKADAAEVGRHVAIVGSIRLTNDVRCCHNDLVAGNILSTPALLLLDWEYACDNDPLFDVATVIVHHRLNDVQASRLLAAWCDDDDRQYRDQLQCQVRLYESLYWLWSTSRKSDNIRGE